MRILNKNCEIILNKLILAETAISSSDIKPSLDISRKTLTAEMHKLDSFLINYGARIRTVNGVGYSIDILEEDKFSEFSEEYLRHFYRDRYMYFDRNYLSYLIVLELLICDDYISVDILTEKYHYSVSTISQNLQKAKKYFKKYNLDLVSRPNYGIKISGSEWSKRICILFTAKVANGINFLQKTQIPVISKFRKMVEKDTENYFSIKQKMEPVLQKHKIYSPLVYQMMLSYYIFLSQSRMEWYEKLEFKEEQIERVQETIYFDAAKDLAKLFGEEGYIIKENDIIGLAIIMDSYATRCDKSGINEEQYEICAEDIHRFIVKCSKLYPGVEHVLDEEFSEEFICYLAVIRERLFFQMPSDEESVYFAKHDGAFISDLCLDFARMFFEVHGIRLETAEFMLAYYIIYNSSARHNEAKAEYRAILVSFYGMHFSRNVAEKLMRIYSKLIIEIIPMELVEVNHTDLSKFDMIITDIAKNQFNNTTLPILHSDIYREDYLRSLDKFISNENAEQLRQIVKESNIIRDADFRNKEDVFEYLAQNYVDDDKRETFLLDCQQDNEFLCFERKNKIAEVSTYPKYYDKKDVIIIFNKNSFYWDNKKVLMIIFFNRRGRKYKEIRIIAKLLNRLFRDVAGVAQNVSRMGFEEFIEYLAHSNKYR